MEDDDSAVPKAGSKEMADMCAAVGELILWASMIDGQLNKALIGALALPEHPMIEPVVAQLDARPKAELLKKRAKFITNASWRNGIAKWVERAEKVNANRNYVAHHATRVRDGRLVFHSDQLGKVLSSLRLTGSKIEIGEDKGIDDVKAWVEHARQVFDEGQRVLANLDRFRTEALKAAARNT